MHTTRPNSISTPAKSPAFDGFAFVKYMRNIGRPYKKQAMELISICRLLAQAQDQASRKYDDLRRVLQVVDNALGSAASAEKAPKDVDEKFKKAIEALSAYEEKFHLRETVAKKMAEAGAKDKSSSTTLNRLKERFFPPKEEETEIVEFLLHKSLPDRSPTVVKQVLGKSSDLKEILWNFSRFRDETKRLTLKQNPHFYKQLPLLPEEYDVKFRSDPIETFRHHKISVLTDNTGPTGRVFLETAKETRAFGNVWAPKDAIIFKDVCGKLEGESIVGAAIQDTQNLWCFEEPPPSPSSRSPNRSSPPPTTNTTPSTPTLLKGDWTEPILRMLRSSDVNIQVNIRISAKPPTNTGPASSLPIPSPVSSRNVVSSSPTPQSRSLTIQIPGGRLLTTSSTRPTPLSQRPPAAEPSPKLRAPAFPEPHAITTRAPLPGPHTIIPGATPPPPSPKPMQSTPLPERPPAAKSSPSPQAPPFPEPHAALPTHPKSTPAPSTAPPLPMPAPLPSPIVAVPYTGPAVPFPTTCQPPDISSREVSREKGALSGDPIPSRAEISTVTMQVLSATIKPRAGRYEAGFAGHIPSRLPSPYSVPTALPTTISTAVPAAAVPATIPTAVSTSVSKPKQKRHWYQKCFDVISNLLPGSS